MKGGAAVGEVSCGIGFSCCRCWVLVFVWSELAEEGDELVLLWVNWCCGLESGVGVGCSGWFGLLLLVLGCNGFFLKEVVNC